MRNKILVFITLLVLLGCSIIQNNPDTARKKNETESAKEMARITISLSVEDAGKARTILPGSLYDEITNYEVKFEYTDPVNTISYHNVTNFDKSFLVHSGNALLTVFGYNSTSQVIARSDGLSLNISAGNNYHEVTLKPLRSAEVKGTLNVAYSWETDFSDVLIKVYNWDSLGQGEVVTGLSPVINTELKTAGLTADLNSGDYLVVIEFKYPDGELHKIPVLTQIYDNRISAASYHFTASEFTNPPEPVVISEISYSHYLSIYWTPGSYNVDGYKVYFNADDTVIKEPHDKYFIVNDVTDDSFPMTVGISAFNKAGESDYDLLTLNFVKFEVNDSIAYISPKVAVAGEKIDPPYEPVKQDHVFGGWYKNESLTEPWDFENDTVTESVVILYAKWGELPKTLTIFQTDELNGESSTTNLTRTNSTVAPSLGYYLNGGTHLYYSIISSRAGIGFTSIRLIDNGNWTNEKVQFWAFKNGEQVAFEEHIGNIPYAASDATGLVLNFNATEFSDADMIVVSAPKSDATATRFHLDDIVTSIGVVDFDDPGLLSGIGTPIVTATLSN